MSRQPKRPYASPARRDAAADTRRRILDAAKHLFGRKGIDSVTIADIGKRAKVAPSTVYAVYKSKDGILRALMQQVLLGNRFQAAQQVLQDVTDPIELVALTAHVARAVYESESGDLGLLRRASGFSPALRRMEQEFEQLRFDLQEARIKALFAARRARRGLSLEDARRIMWMYTSREVYQMLVHDGGWSPDKYQDWLSRALLDALVAPSG
jgi:AcrR family transcriptional regulator